MFFCIYALTCVTTSFPSSLEYILFISSRFAILNMHIVDVVCWSIILFPSPYKYSSEFNPVNKSFLTILSNVFWCTTVFNTDTILSFITSKTAVSTLSKSCGVPLSIIQYPI